MISRTLCSKSVRVRKLDSKILKSFGRLSEIPSVLLSGSFVYFVSCNFSHLAKLTKKRCFVGLVQSLYYKLCEVKGLRISDDPVQFHSALRLLRLFLDLRTLFRDLI